MHIVWKGCSYFQLMFIQKKGGRVFVVINPSCKKGSKISGANSDILLLTHTPYEIGNIKDSFKGSFLIDGPGEYEIKEIFIQGMPAFLGGSAEKQGKSQSFAKAVKRASFYVIEAEEMKICHLKELGQEGLKEDQIEKIGNVDILMLSIKEGNGVAAAKIVSQIDPKIVIPMDYQFSEKEELSQFLKAIGKKSVEPQDKLTLKKKDLPAEEMRVVVLKP